jgi:hypothetical protein
VERSRFDYQAEVWVSETYQLPKFGSSYVILSPKDMLRREETWINRRELVGNFRQLAASLPDGVLRAQLNNYLAMQLIYAPDATEKERNEKYQRVVNDALFKFPGVIEHYIRQKEDDGDKATAVSSEEVREVADWFVEKVREAVAGVLSPSGFYDLAYNSYAAALERLKFLKRCIEDMDLYRLFYHDDKPIQREQDLQLLYKLTWFGSVFDLNAEVNNGRGPVDFKASRGSQDMSLVEFKLAKNPHLKRSLQNQLAIYERANNTKKSIWGIFFFSSEEERRASGILTEVGMAGADNVVMIDCRDDNKPSASHA